MPRNNETPSNAEINAPLSIQPPQPVIRFEEWSAHLRNSRKRSVENLRVGLQEIVDEYKKELSDYRREYKKKLDDSVLEYKKELDEQTGAFREQIENDLKKIEGSVSKLEEENHRFALSRQEDSVKTKEEPEEIHQLKEEVKELKEENIQLKEEVRELKEENATLKSYIQYLWKLIISFFEKPFTALGKNLSSFFTRKNNPSIATEAEQENVNTHRQSL